MIIAGVLLAGMVAPLIVLAQEKNETPEIVLDDASCSQRIGVLNYRSQLLTSYKDTEERRYESYRKKWSTRIAYAGQWVKEDAESMRSNLYEMDRYHKVFISEVDKQAEDYRYLETAPLNCSAEMREQVLAKLTEVQGAPKGKPIGGHALIQKKKREFVQLQKNKFEPGAESLIEQLHKAKRKTPNPKTEQIEILKY